MIEQATATLLLRLIRLYQILFSPWVGRQCRFHPSCSTYATEAIHAWGPWKGASLTVQRILRCNPWFEGGFDPVPLRTGVFAEDPDGRRVEREKRGQSCCHPK